VNDLSVLNPFRANIVQDAWQSPADVAEINADAFRACLDGIASATSGVSDSLLVFGPAGSGKTHLLTRLQRHLSDTAAAAPDRVLHCVFVFVRLQTNPTLLWQHVRKRLSYDLMRREQGVTQLQRLLAHQMSLGAGASPRARVMSFRVLSESDQATLMQHLESVADTLRLPRDVCIVLKHLVCNRHVRDASAWLAGESLPDSVLIQLGVGPDVVEDRESAAREVVTALCRLAGETLPIVFCFDQVEALQRGVDDREAFYAFGRTAADLCDADPNVFIITCLQSSYVDVFKTAVRGADRDRMARREAVLDPLTRGQIELLLRTRLASIATVSIAAALPAFVLTPRLLDEFAQDTPTVARRVLAHAAQVFDEQQRATPRRPKETSQFLREQFEACRVRAARESRAADTERIVLGGLEVMKVLRGLDSEVTDPRLASFVLKTEPPTAVHICNEADARSVAPRLKRIAANLPRKDGYRTVLLRDPRQPIAKGATKTRGYIETLRKQGAAFVEPTIEALLALAALGQLLADAKSGDLEHDGEAITESRVVAWLRSLEADLLFEAVGELVNSLTETPVSTGTSVVEDLAELLSRKRILDIEEASAHLDVHVSELREAVHRASNRFLVLKGPPEVVLDIAGVATDSEVRV
jgi:hypothetical protein